VIVVTKETSHARKLHAFVQSSIPQCAEHVRMLPSGEFFSFFDTLVGTMNPKEETARGRLVKVHQVATSVAVAAQGGRERLRVNSVPYSPNCPASAVLRMDFRDE
jgi:hypothetical protein